MTSSPVAHDNVFLGQQADLRQQLRRAGFDIITTAGQDYERALDRLRLEMEVDRYVQQSRQSVGGA